MASNEGPRDTAGVTVRHVATRYVGRMTVPATRVELLTALWAAWDPLARDEGLDPDEVGPVVDGHASLTFRVAAPRGNTRAAAPIDRGRSAPVQRAWARLIAAAARDFLVVEDRGDSAAAIGWAACPAFFEADAPRAVDGRVRLRDLTPGDARRRAYVEGLPRVC